MNVSGVSTFAGDVSIAQNLVHTGDEHTKLQDDLNQCEEWANVWGMEFHPKKCKLLHFGRNNPGYSYHLGGHSILTYDEEKDLGVHITNDLRWDAHIAASIKKANQMIGMIRRTFCYMDIDMFNSLYKTFVRPMLEYAPQIWNPHLSRNIEALEKVQRRATKMVPELKDLPYDQRLVALKLFPLKDRRLRGDMIATYKMMEGLIDINYDKIIPLKEVPGIMTRSHSKQLKGTNCNTVWRKNFFTQRIVRPWNELTKETVESSSIDIFKERYDKEILGRYK